jgi:hypothetical protein
MGPKFIDSLKRGAHVPGYVRAKMVVKIANVPILETYSAASAFFQSTKVSC